MRAINILYYYWGEVTADDCICAMQDLNYNVTKFSGEIEDYNFDEKFVSVLMEQSEATKCDCIFSFDYFPVISWFCMEAGIKYYSWVYDSPNLTLSSVSINNPCNEIFIFDKGLYEKCVQNGATKVHYLPLAFRRKRLEAISFEPITDYRHEITFLGNLYDDEYNYYDQIKGLPDDIKGEIDNLILRQQQDFVHDLFEEFITHEMCHELMRYVQFDLGPYYKGYHDDVFRNMFRKKVTVEERRGLLELLSREHKVDLFSSKKPEGMNVNFCGYADYYNQMPQIFHSGKINLNITVRTNYSGIPLRVIDIIGAKGFVLTSYQSELEDYFENDKSIVWFKTPEEMLDKVNYYLHNNEKRNAIIQNAYDIAKDVFTYEHLLPQIFSM